MTVHETRWSAAIRVHWTALAFVCGLLVGLGFVYKPGLPIALTAGITFGLLAIARSAE